MYRIGQGFDIHKLVEGRKLILGGIKIDYDKGLLGHSDADVLIHSIIDALLGALSLQDIGSHFPDTDSKYSNIDSSILLKETYNLIVQHGYIINNIDNTILAQEPKMRPYIPLMIENLSKFLDIDKTLISIKAKTMEGQDSVGEQKSIAVHTTLLLKRIKKD